jgi:hypothetical protein
MRRTFISGNIGTWSLNPEMFSALHVFKVLEYVHCEVKPITDDNDAYI